MRDADGARDDARAVARARTRTRTESRYLSADADAFASAMDDAARSEEPSPSGCARERCDAIGRRRAGANARDGRWGKTMGAIASTGEGRVGGETGRARAGGRDDVDAR
jgi:hypothetical protein